jgi:hypothetical protein
MFLHFHNGICDKQDASSEGQKGENYLVHSQGCMVDIQDTPSQISASRLTSVRLFGVLEPSDHLLGLLEKLLGGHRCQTDAEVQDGCSQHFHSQSLEFYDEGIHSLIML